MYIGELSEIDAIGILRKENVGRLGCIAAGWPYVLPVNYFFDGKDIYSHTLPGKKLNAMRANPNVCLQVDEIENSYNWRSVIAYGTFEEISNEETRNAILAGLHNRLPHMTPVESNLVEDMKEIIVFRIKVKEVTGRAENW